MSSVNNLIVIQCSLTEASRLQTALEQAIIKLQEAKQAPRISYQTVRGADAVTLAKFTLDISVHVDVVQVLIAVSSLLIATRARVIFRGKDKMISKAEDVYEIVPVATRPALPKKEADVTPSGPRSD